MFSFEMILLTRLNGSDLVVNAAHIATVEATPDTLITLLGGEKLLVHESPDEVTRRVTQYWRALTHGPHLLQPCAATRPGAEES